MPSLGLLCLLLAYFPVPTLSIKHWEESTQRWKYTFTNVVYLLRFSQWRLKRWKITGKPSHAIAMLMISFCLVNHITCLSCYFYIYFYNIFTYTVSQSLLFLFTNKGWNCGTGQSGFNRLLPPALCHSSRSRNLYYGAPQFTVEVLTVI